MYSLTMQEEFEMFCVYEKPKDFPNSWVVRRICVIPGLLGEIMDQHITLETSTHGEIEEWALKKGLTRLPRSSEDPPQIVETWI